MRSRLDSDPRPCTPFLRSRSPYKQLVEASDEHPIYHDQFYLSQRSDAVEDDTSDSSKLPIITQSQSNPPSPTSFFSFNSSTSSVNDPFTLHPMASDTSISSSRSMPVQSTRSAVELYVIHDIKPKALTKLRRPKPKALFLNDSSPSLEAPSAAESPRIRETRNTSPPISRSNSISSSLRVLGGSLRRRYSTRVAAPAVTVTPSTPTLMSPLSPLDPPSETERRFRQLHKLTRTLGENIPAELIFGPSHEDDGSPMAPKSSGRYRSRRGTSLPFAPLILPPSDEPITKPISIPSSPDRPSSLAFEVDFIDSARPGSVVSPITFAIPNLPPTPPRFRALPDFPEDVSANGSPHSPISPTTSEENVNPFLILRPDTPFMNAAVPVETTEKLRPESEYRSAVRRDRRQGWSGEWNRQDMRDVIAQLRALK